MESTLFFSLVMAIVGHNRSFQANNNTIIPIAVITDLDKGSTIDVNILTNEQPSILAASSSSSGKLRKLCLRKKVTEILIKLGTITAARVSASPIALTILYFGIKVICCGIIIIQIITANRYFFPGKFSLANAYAAIDAVTS